ncbi:MAG: hypothetical protein ACR2JA_11780 [Hydrogenophaga sp.]|uniref:hypothetical protein n=1 Tax=Hydrogenophaga sp. TaxID=1904254 RepID=UPI003D9B9111
MIKAADILAALKTSNPALLKGLPDQRALRLIRHTLQSVGDAVEKGGEEPVRVMGLGVFRQVTGKKMVDGQAVETQRTVFRRLKAKAPAKA